MLVLTVFSEIACEKQRHTQALGKGGGANPFVKFSLVLVSIFFKVGVCGFTILDA